MRKSLLLLPLSVISFSAAISQATGDYRSAASGSWSAAATWQRFDGANWVAAPAAPSSTDGVITILNTHTVTASSVITADQVVVDNGGTLSITGNTFTVANGADANDLTSNGAISFSGGTIAGAGNMIVNGSFNWTNGSLNCPTTLAATATMTINVTSDLRLISTLVNNGTINWIKDNIRFQGGTLTNNAAFNISNTADQFENFSGGTFTNSATGTVTKSTADNFTNNITLNNNGTFQLTAGTFVNASTFTNTGSFVFTAATILQNGSIINFNAGTSLSGTGSFNQTSGTVNVNLALNIISTITINFSSGTIAGSGSLAINGTFNWTNGFLNCPTTLAATATMTINVTSDLRLISTLVNNGTINWIKDNIRFQGGTLTNNAAFNISNTADQFENFSGGTFTNSATGTVTKSTADNFTNNITLNNNGTFQLTAGTFVNASTFTNTGSFVFTAATILQNGSIINFNAGTSLSGTGSFNQTSGTVNVNLALNIISTITINFSSGTIAGSGSLAINGTFNWTNGFLNCPTTLAATATMTINVTSDLRLISTLVNNGTINWIKDNIRFQGGTLTNNAAFNISNTADQFENFSGGTFTNSATGTVTKSTADNFTNNITLNNNGTFQLTAGTFVNASTFTNTGSFVFTAATILQNGSIINFNAGTSLSGTGSFNQTSGTVNVNLALNIISTITINFSSGTIAGSGSLAVNGTFNWTNGFLNCPTTLAATATMTINVTSDLRLISTLVNNGTINWIKDNIRFQGGTLTNNAAFNISNTADQFENFSGGTFTNSATGTVTKSTADNFTNNITFNNNGTFQLTAGTFVNASTFTNTGSFVFTATTILQNGSTINFNAGTSLSGTGDFDQTGGTSNFNTAVNIISTIIINFSGGTIAGSGSITGNGAFNWTNGSLNVPTILTATAIMTVNVTSDLRLLNTLINNGTINWNNGDIRFQGGTLTNNAAFNISNTATDFENFSSGTYTNSVTGTVTKSTAGTTSVNINFSNAGIIKGIGSISFNGTLTNTGTIAPGLSPGILTANSVSALFSVTSTLAIEIQDATGPGTGHDQLQRATNLVLTGTLTVVETGTVPGGDYTIISLTSGTISGTFTTTNLPADYSVIYNSDNVIVRKGALATWYRDFDGDTYGDPTNTTQAAAQPAGYVSNNTDCNDNNANIHPGATELCNGVDDDCDGQIDEGVLTTFYQDADGDGFGNPAVTQQACSAPNGYVANNTDCNDNNANIHPGATEVCNGVDDDCDSQIDEGVTTTFYQDSDGDGFGNSAVPQQACSLPNGYVANNTDCNDNNANIHPGAAEICNGVDDDCNNQIDEGGALTTFYQDADSDGFGNPAVSQQACAAPNGYVANSADCNDNNAAINPNTIWYLDADNDNYYTGSGVTQCASPGAGYKFSGLLGGNDCNDNNLNIHPGATEICNGVDDDCDSQVDEGGQTTFYQDLDNDGFGNIAVTQQACSAPNGYVANNTDCNDNNANIHPGATEVCNGIDDDCDSQVDEGVQTTFYQDLDADGFGNPAVTQQACSVPNGYVANNTDCNDVNAAINPNTLWYLDADNDNYYTGSSVTQCTSPGEGYKFSGLLGGNDCNDNNPNIHPGAIEICNNLDDDCDEQIDEGAQPVNWYQDIDGDGFGNASITQSSCAQPAGYVLSNTDCNDNNANIHPGATEICNGADDDCDSQIDEGVQTTFYRDFDNDGFGDPAVTQQACAAPNGYVVNNTDCNDNNTNIHPGATEICNGIDDDCDNQVDEGVQTTFYQDLDADGFGNPAVTQQACSVPNGYIANNTDCNDNNAAINPNTVWYLDTDNDNYYTGSGVTQCTSPGAGYKFSGLLEGNDCNDNNANIYPGATEICNGLDDDCDGQIDEDAQPVNWYQDLDGDGFGNAAVTQSSCTQPAGYVLNNTDCDDNNGAINPNTIWNLDADNDNYYTGTGITQCTSPGAGYKSSGLLGGNDCNDSNPNIHPGVVEVCNGLDDDCDGQIDEGVQTTFYQDSDADGFGNLAVSQQACTAPNGFVINNTDCNDNNAVINPNTVWFLDADNDNYYIGMGITQCTSPGEGYKFSGLLGGGDCNDNSTAINPGAAEVCGNATDDDCDGQVDEGCGGNPDSDGDGYTVEQGDCNDNNPAIHPAAAEICGNNIDDNCNSYVDENCLPDLPVITLRTYPVKEGDAGIAMLKVEVTVDQPAPTQLQLNYATSNEDAMAGLDYVAANGVLIIPAGATSGIVEVGIIGDLLRENNERFRLNFSNPINVVIEGNPYSRIMIIDDDKGKPNVVAMKENEISEVQSRINIPNVSRRNQIWNIPTTMTLDNEVVIFNMQGRVIFSAKNYKNNIVLPNVSTGIYFYQISYRNEKGKMIIRNGKLLITE